MNDSKINNGKVKINLGSGFSGLPGWLNYDNSIVARFSRFPFLIRICVKLGLLVPGYLDVKWPPVVCHDCRHGIPLKDNSVDCVYTSHFLEHLYRHEVINILKESFRVLKPGGLIRIVVPDGKQIAQKYLSSDNDFDPPLPNDNVISFARCDWFAAQFLPVNMNMSVKPGTKRRFTEHFLRHHKWIYDYESMSLLVGYAGFVRIYKHEFQQGEMDDVERLDVHKSGSLHIEARKP